MYVTLFQANVEIRGLEATWVEIQVRSKKVLIGGFYRPPESPADYTDLISGSFNRAYDTNIQDIIILGDFNINMFHDSNNKMKYIMQEFNMKQLIKEPTNFTKTSATLIDLILVRNDTNILTSEVLDSFIPERINYHCPVMVLLKFLRPANKTHQENMSVKCVPPQTPLLYSKTGVCRGKPIFLIFAPKHRLWVLVRTASARRF